jgi:AAA+ ATPase superfamily predicted ATPase
MTKLNIPYHFCTRITQKSLFFNRKSDIDFICNALSGPQMNNISITGDRKIGKSSLLWSIINNTPLPDTNFILFDLQSKTDVDKLQKTISPISHTLFQKRTVLLIDELEAGSLLGEDFFKQLRAFSQKPNTALITSSSLQIADICPDFKDYSSPFYNIFIPRSLGPFSEYDCLQILSELPARAGIQLSPQQKFNANEMNLIIELAACQPWKLQLFAYYFFDAKVNNNIDISSLRQQINGIINIQLGKKPLFPTKISMDKIHDLLAMDVSPAMKSLCKSAIMMIGEYVKVHVA